MEHFNNMTATAAQLAAGQPTKLPEVSAELESLGFYLENLDKLVEMLELRLVTVLAKREVSTNGQASSPEPVRVPLADSLHQAVLRVQHLGGRINSMTERIEL